MLLSYYYEKKYGKENILKVLPTWKRFLIGLIDGVTIGFCFFLLIRLATF